MNKEQKEKTAREELTDWVKESLAAFLTFLKPNPKDNLVLQIVKTILKIPVTLFIVLVSPVLLLILGIIFAMLL
ncbi:MAG: hypothetical protein BGO09_08185 [Bacteroidetes bacterium 47-18]|nr:MAG: hypothetical protein BGO09_08185 [Bacteroidetes bacterium 47-18]